MSSLITLLVVLACTAFGWLIFGVLYANPWLFVIWLAWAVNRTINRSVRRLVWRGNASSSQ